MITTTFSKLRNKAKYYFDEVEHGETLQIPGISLSKAIIAER